MEICFFLRGYVSFRECKQLCYVKPSSIMEFQFIPSRMRVELTQPMDPEKKSLNFIFPTKYVIPKSLKFSHWPSKRGPI